ncbi:MAG: malonyl-CoA synthase [Candidatus Puniceispirillum sp.]
MSNLLYDRLFGCHAGETKPFLIFADGSDQSYDGFLRQTARFANVITDLGLVVGDRLAAQVEKSAAALALYAACVQSGVIFLPLNTAYTPAEVSYFVGDSGAKLVVADAGFDLAAVAAEHGAVLETLNADGGGSFADRAATANETFATVNRGADDLAAFLYTSGTTGRSKGAMLTQRNLLSNAETLIDEWRFTADDVLLHALPIFHTHGLFVATNIILLAKASMIFLPKFAVDPVLALLPKASSMMGVPTFYTRLLDDPRLTPDLTRHMRLFISGSAPLLAETHIQFEQRTGHRILERYGMTETNMNTSNPYDGERRAGTVGFALPGVDIKVTDPETGATLPDGEIGQIEVRGPNVFVGYWNMPEKTREELREDGFFITGDLGRIDEKGYLVIVGRNKDLIISGGYNIYPKEIELLLDEQPGVVESAVIGAPHPDFGESVVGILVAEKGQSIDLAAIEANLGTSLARFKQPRKLIVVDTLPRNTMGKVQKNILRDSYGDVFQA